MSLTLAIMIHATAVVIDFSKSLPSRRLRFDPGEGPLDDPAARRQHETFGNVRPLDDVDRPHAEWHEGLLEFLTRIAAIGEDVAQPREGASDPDHDPPATDVILHVDVPTLRKREAGVPKSPVEYVAGDRDAVRHFFA
jgi:hypothetical protein